MEAGYFTRNRFESLASLLNSDLLMPVMRFPPGRRVDDPEWSGGSQ